MSAFPAAAPELAKAISDLGKMAAFANGSGMQRRYEDLRRFVQDEAAEALALGVSQEDVDEIRATLADEDCYATNRIVLANKRMAAARKTMETALAEARSRAKASIEDLRRSYASTYDLNGLREAGRAAFEGIFDGYVARAAQAGTKAEADALPGLLQSREAAAIIALFTPSKGDGKGSRQVPLTAAQQRRLPSHATYPRAALCPRLGENPSSRPTRTQPHTPTRSGVASMPRSTTAIP